VLEDAGVLVAALELVLDGVLAGTAEGEEAGVEGAGVEEAVDVGLSDVLGAVSFFSPVAATGTSLPAEGFILSE
jgi:hypothetical protein